jgi:hypothetical protein
MGFTKTRMEKENEVIPVFLRFSILAGGRGAVNSSLSFLAVGVKKHQLHRIEKLKCL